MGLRLNSWEKNWALMKRFFTADEIAKISGRLKDLKIQNVAFCSFESRFARSGGLAAVTMNILPYLKEVNKIPNVFLMTPFYSTIMDKTKLKPTGKHFSVQFNNKAVIVELYEYTWNYSKPRNGSVKEYYLKADGFFETSGIVKDPYVYNESDRQLNDKLMSENVLFFCKAVPYALQSLGILENIIFHLQEWQTSLISLTAKEAMLDGTLQSCGSVQTMHNSYDSFVSWQSLSVITKRALKQKTGTGLTAYQIGLQLIDAPITTVSDNFAKEFTTDILQTDYFAPHLQNIFKKSGVYGVNNGMFIEVSPDFARREKHTIDELRRIKLQKRKALLTVLDTYKPKERFGELTYRGKSISRLPDDIPIVVMSGRLDPMQKGYDVLLRAVEKFSVDEVKAVLTPMAVRSADLDYFYEVASKCKGNLTVFSVRLEKGYHELQSGATFGIMPSIYEPFGAAVEYMANGTVNIGRATGGLVDQISPECGFLYKEDAASYTLGNIRSFVETGDVVQMRKMNPWVRSMADNLYDVLKKAFHMYQHDQKDYYKLIRNGLKKVNSFSWESSSKKYYTVFEKVREV